MSPRGWAWVLGSVMVARMGLDAAWAVDIGPWPLTQVGGGILAGIVGLVALAHWRRLQDNPLSLLTAVWVAVVTLGALRAHNPVDGVRYGVSLAFPAVYLLVAVPVFRDAGPALANELLRLCAAAAAVLVTLSLGALALGQPAEHVLHGWPRLIGVYGNLHTHAAVMALIATTALTVGVRRGHRWALVLGVAASVCVVATFVRGAWLWVAFGTAIGVASRYGRPRAAAIVVGVLTVAALAAWVRLDDVWAIVTATPPEGGWGALGSWRVRIWGDVFTGYLAGPWPDVVLGRGLGGQMGLHRHLDPHSDALSVLVTLGPVGLAVAGWGIVAVLRRVHALAHVLMASTHADVAAAALGNLAAAVVVGTVSNDVLFRPTVLLGLAALVALALSQPAEGGDEGTEPP